MILPCPLKPGSKIQLLDLSNGAFDFKELESAFPSNKLKRRSRSLEVFEIGAYNISVALSLDDLTRINTKVFQVINAY